jgi:hypothetical protein
VKHVFKMVKGATKVHSVLYKAKDEGQALTNAYVMKTHLVQEGVKGFPDEITITVEF